MIPHKSEDLRLSYISIYIIHILSISLHYHFDFVYFYLLIDTVSSSMCSMASALQVASAGYSGWLCSSGSPIISYCSWAGVICTGTAVTEINLSSFSVSGSIPSSIGYLTHITYLSLFNNDLISSIPSSVGYLTSSYYLDLSYNKLTSSIPSSIGYLTALTNLWLSYNKLIGTIPSSIGFLTLLSGLYVNDNSLSGSVPSFLCAVTVMTKLVASSNRFTCYASCLSTVSSAYFDASTEKCTSGLYYNVPIYISRPLYPYALYISFVSVYIAILISCYFYLLIVTVSSSMCSMASALQVASAGYSGWLCSSGSSIISSCSWAGVTCTGSAITKINLAFFSVSGSIPSSVGYLTSLNYLNLCSNKLTNSIPSSIGYLTALTTLWLSSNKLISSIPSSIGFLTLLSELFVDLNSLSGTIPSSLCAVTVMTKLVASSNRFTCYASCLSTVSSAYFDASTGECVGQYQCLNSLSSHSEMSDKCTAYNNADTPCFPEVQHYIGMSFDVTKADDSDTAFGSRVIEFSEWVPYKYTYNGCDGKSVYSTYMIPANVEIKHISSASLSSVSSAIDSLYSTTDSFTRAISAGIRTPNEIKSIAKFMGTSAGIDSEQSKTVSSQLSSSKYSFRSRYTIDKASITINRYDHTCKSDFLNDVTELGISISTNEFIEKYGTHVVHSVNVGGVATTHYSFSSCTVQSNYYSSSTKSVDLGAAAAALNAAVQDSIEKKSASFSFLQTTYSTSGYAIYGGDTNTYQNSFGTNSYKWTCTILDGANNNNGVTHTSIELVPIWQLVPSGKKSVLQDVIQNYLNGTHITIADSILKPSCIKDSSRSSHDSAPCFFLYYIILIIIYLIY
jgi:Leucine-rich repeat (LRR) protein